MRPRQTSVTGLALGSWSSASPVQPRQPSGPVSLTRNKPAQAQQTLEICQFHGSISEPVKKRGKSHTTLRVGGGPDRIIFHTLFLQVPSERDFSIFDESNTFGIVNVVSYKISILFFPRLNVLDQNQREKKNILHPCPLLKWCWLFKWVIWV